MTRTKTDEDKQTARFGFTCTETEAKEIRALAKAHGINQHSVFVRLACLGIIPVDRNRIATTSAMTAAIPSEAKPSEAIPSELPPWDPVAQKEQDQRKAEELKRTLPTLTAENFYTVTKPLEGWERRVARHDVMSAEERAKLDDIDWEKTQAREAREAAEREAAERAAEQEADEDNDNDS